MSGGQMTDLLHRLQMTVSTNNKWDANTQIQNVMFVSPDRQFAWLFRISPQGRVFPSSGTCPSDHNCHLYIHNVSACQTVSECLTGFGIRVDQWSDFQVLNSIGEPIHPATAHVQTVVLKSKP